MIHRIDETIEMKNLPTWLQELWDLEPSLARRAEKHYLELTKQCNIADVMGWRFVKDNEENLKAMPNDRDFEVLFDDGTILNFSDEDFPFAEIIAWREIACP